MYPRIKELRLEKKKTQLQVSIALEMQQSHYAKYERAARNPSVTTLKKIARYYNTSIDYIIGETDVRRRYD